MIHGFDWLNSFEQRFDNHIELHNLKTDKFHGSVTINFSDGVPMNCNLNRHLRVKNKDMSTLTKGGSNV